MASGSSRNHVLYSPARLDDIVEGEASGDGGGGGGGGGGASKAATDLPQIKVLYKIKKQDEPISLFETFQSKDLIIPPEKNVELQRSGHHQGHATSGSTHKTSYLETFQHLFKCFVGSGIFALGDAFKNAGLLLAASLTLVLGFICVHAQYMLLNCNEEVTRKLGDSVDTYPDYAETVELCFATGPLRLRKYSTLMRKLVNLFICITQLGFCCVYIVFVADNIQQVLQTFNINIEIHAMMAIVLLPILLSTWIRNLKYLVPLSSFANLLMIYGVFAAIYIMSQDLPSPSERHYVGELKTMPLFFGTVIFCFEGIALILPLRSEMKRPRNFDKPLGVLNVGMVIISVLFVSFGFLSYLKYGETVKGSVTLNLEPLSAPIPLSIRIAISLSIGLSYALQFYVPISFTWPDFEQRFGPFSWPVTVEILFRTGFCLITFILAEAIPKLGLFISLIGAVSSTALAIFFPVVIDTVLKMQNGTLSTYTIIKNLGILLVGLIGFATGTYESLTQIVEYFQHGDKKP